MTIDAPTCRATIRDGLVTLNRWTPGLFGRGPEPAGFRTITAALADLRFEDDELIVTPVPRTPWSADAEAAILRWAPTVGYRRVWLPRRVVTFDEVAPLGLAARRLPDLRRPLGGRQRQLLGARPRRRLVPWSLPRVRRFAARVVGDRTPRGTPCLRPTRTSPR